MEDDITITTCLYDIRSKENGEKVRQIKDYFELGKSMLQVRLPLIVYTDNDLVVDEVMTERNKHGLGEKTTIVRLPFEDTFYYKDLDKLKECMKQHELSNSNKEKDTPLYVILNNNKFDFLWRTMDTNPYGSSFFFWMDYGIQHCAKASDDEWKAVWEEWPQYIRNEKKLIHHLRVHTVARPNKKSWKDYFKVIYHHIAGSLFGGHNKPLMAYTDLFKEQWRKMLYEENWWQLDEAVMTIVVEENPELFRLWYGDYDGLITNFIHSKRSLKQVFQTLQRHLDSKNYIESEKVLNTLDEVMKNPQNDHYFQWYITHRSTNDYYKWKKCLSPPLCELLCNNTLIENHQHVKGNIKNFRYYNEKCVMKFLAQWVFHDPRNKNALLRWNEFHDQCETWIPIGNRCLSSLALEANNMRKFSLPLDYLDTLPNQVLKLFRRQFVDFYTADTMSDDYINNYGIWFENFINNSHVNNETKFKTRVDRLYGLLEYPKTKTVFLHTTEIFLMRPFTKEEKETYDQELIALCYYIERNFPLLDFVMVCLYTNRELTAPDEIPERMVVLYVDTPYSYGKNLGKDIPTPWLYAYREGIYEWLRILAS